MKKKSLVRISGGLGNQLFKFLAALNFAERQDRELFVDISWYENSGKDSKIVSARQFELPFFPQIRELIRVKEASNDFMNLNLARLARRMPTKMLNLAGIITDRNAESIQIRKACYIEGNFENWKVLPTDYKLQNLLTFPVMSSKKITQNQLFGKDEFIAVHVRRGDFLNLPHIYDVLTPKYYSRAIASMRKKVGDLPLVLFSDSPKDADKWLRPSIVCDIIASSEKSNHSVDGMHLMSKASGIICAHSTFSWWAAKIGTLNQNTRHVILPSRYFNNFTPIGHDLHFPEFEVVQVN